MKDHTAHIALFLLAGWLIASQAVASSPDESPDPPAFNSAVLNGLQVTVRLSDYDFTVDEKVLVEVWLTNRSSSNMSVCVFPSGFTISARLVANGGNLFPTEDGYVSAGDPSVGIGDAAPLRRDYVELRPSESWKPFGDDGIPLLDIIGRHLDVRDITISPGTYELRLRFSQKVFDGSEFSINAWKGSVESNPVTLRILPGQEASQLLRQLKHPVPEKRAEAAGILGTMREASAVPALIQNLASRSDTLRINCANALGLIGDPRAVESLVTMLNDPDRDVVMQAAMALGRIGDERAVEPLTGFLLGNDEEGRLIALRAFQLMPGQTPLDKILPLVGKGSRAVRHEALRTVPVLLATDQETRGQVAAALIAASKDEYFQIRGDAVERLALLGDVPGVIGTIGRALDDDSPYVRKRAVTALGILAPREAADLIRPLLEDPDPEVRLAALEALRKSVGNRIE